MRIVITGIALLLAGIIYAQSEKDKKAVEKACMNYLDAFYEGDTLKIAASIRPSLNKLGYFKDKKTGNYKKYGYMSFDQAKKYAKAVSEDGSLVRAKTPKKVEVLDVMNHIASAKVTAWWGTDFLLLSKEDDAWMIEQVLWEGPLKK